MYNWFNPFIYGGAKLSVLFFYRSIFRGRRFDIASWTLIVICGLWTLFSFLFGILQCGSHVDYLWGSAAEIASKCFDGWKSALPSVIVDVSTDLMILILPLFWVSIYKFPSFN